MSKKTQLKKEHKLLNSCYNCKHSLVQENSVICNHPQASTFDFFGLQCDTLNEIQIGALFAIFCDSWKFSRNKQTMNQSLLLQSDINTHIVVELYSKNAQNGFISYQITILGIDQAEELNIANIGYLGSQENCQNFLALNTKS